MKKGQYRKDQGRTHGSLENDLNKTFQSKGEKATHTWDRPYKNSGGAYFGRIKARKGKKHENTVN